jgi:hypothetical protein
MAAIGATATPTIFIINALAPRPVLDFGSLSLAGHAGKAATSPTPQAEANAGARHVPQTLQIIN